MMLQQQLKWRAKLCIFSDPYVLIAFKLIIRTVIPRKLHIKKKIVKSWTPHVNSFWSYAGRN